MGITADLRWTAAKLMNIGKIAVDSALREGKPKGVKRSSSVMMEEMQAKLEKLRRDENNIEQRQQQQPSEITTEEKEPQLLKNGMPEESFRRKIFIRSRL